MYGFDASRNLLALLVGALFPCSQISTEDLRRQLSTGQKKKILVIRIQQGLGDLVLATPVFQALQEQYPGVTLHFMGSPRNAAAVKTNPRIAKLWIWDKAKAWYPATLLTLIPALRREQFDLALVLTGNAPSLTAYLIARTSGARWVGSSESDAPNRKNNWSRALTHWQVPAAPGPEEYQKFFAVVAPLVDRPCPSPEFYIPSEVTAWARTKWDLLGFAKESAPISLFLGGNLNHAHRLWKPASWARLAALLVEKHMGPVIAVCPPRQLASPGVQEADYYAEFRQAYGRDIPIFDEPGLPQAAAFLKHTALFICPDGGLFHVAAAAGVRTLGLFFGTAPAQWKPPVANVTCLHAPEGEPDRLTPQMVLDTALRLVGQQTLPGSRPPSQMLK